MSKEKVKALWRCCFNDSEEFIDMYFRLRYTNDNNMALQEGDNVISALQMLPYPMSFCGKTIQTSYISGACTHPDYRSKGIMRELLSHAFAKMQQNNIPLTTLIPAEPWLFSYYARMGYAPVFRYSTKRLSDKKPAPEQPVSIDETSVYDEQVYQFINRKMRERPCCIQHTEADFQVILTDMGISSSRLYVARQQDKVTGIAIADMQGSDLVINELLTEDTESERALIHFILQKNSVANAHLIAPPIPNKEQTPLGMARIIHAAAILQLYAACHPELEVNIELTDQQLAFNNGYYYLSNGKCMQSSRRLSVDHQSFGITDLCEWIFAPLQPYMSLMLN